MRPLLVASFPFLLTSAFAQAQAPPVAPVKPVTDTYFGTQVTDPYRWMEDSGSTEFAAWMKAQSDDTRSILDRIPGRKALADRITALSEAGTAVKQVTSAGDRYFYVRRAPGDDDGKLYVREGLRGKERLLLDPTRIGGKGGPHFSLDYFTPSLDGHFVAYGISPGGSEESVLHVLDAGTGRSLPESIDRAELGVSSWLPDGRSFFYSRLQKLAKGAPETDKYLKARTYLHTVGAHVDGDGDTPVFGFDVSPRVPVDPAEFAYVLYSPASTWALGIIVKGVKNEISIYEAPADSIGRPDTPWQRIAGEDQAIVNVGLHGNDVYLLTHKDAPRYKLTHTSLLHPDVANAEAILPPGDAVLTNLGVAQDALYVQELDGGIGRIMRVPFDGGPPKLLALPFEGSVNEFVTNPRKPGLLVKLMSWTQPQLWYFYDPATNQVADTGLCPRSPVDYSEIESREVKVVGYDGTLIPLSIVLKKGLALDGRNSTLLAGYGAYGITLDPGFDPVRLAWLERGGIYAVAHVRGGGEYGEDWHTAGQKTTKLNTVWDFIACAEYLIDEKYTTSSRIAGLGVSAGGITVGRALTLRPELFAAILDQVGDSDTLRDELAASGPANIPEFGTVKEEEGFRGLYAMSPYAHVRAGTPYPAVLLSTGIHDPRVDSWEAAKMAARLQAATSSGKPILLRVDYDAGHGFGSTKSQTNAQIADQWSFLLWQFGDPAFQPKP